MLHLLYSLPSFEDSAQNRNRTSDTRIFSPLLYRLSYLGIHTNVWVAGAGFEPTTFGLWARRATRLLHPAMISHYSTFFLNMQWAEVDSNHRSKLQQIYSLSPLATRESAHLKRSIWNWLILILKINWEKPMIGLEPITCWLQISCSANWATSAYQMGPIGLEPMTLCL